MKKLKTLTALIAMLCCCSISAHDFEEDGIYYRISSTEDKTVEVTYRGGVTYDAAYSGNVVIPSFVIYEGDIYGVTGIGIDAFLQCSDLTSITIPNSVTSIGNHAFKGCTGLTSITIPESVTRIGDQAFFGCSKLSSITILEGVKIIGEAAFRGCSSLTSITIPNSVTNIGQAAFYGCNN